MPEQFQPGLDVAFAILHDGQPAQAVTDVGMLRSADPPLNRQRALVSRDGFVVALHLPVQRAQVVQHPGHIEIVLAEHADAHGESLLV